MTRDEHRVQIISAEQHDRIRSILNRMTYKPSMEVRIVSLPLSGDGHILISYRYEAEDIDCPGRMTFVAKCVPYPVQELARKSGREIVMMFTQEIREMEEHELQEWLYFNGEHVIDPHPGLESQPARNERKSLSTEIEDWKRVHVRVPTSNKLPAYIPNPNMMGLNRHMVDLDGEKILYDGMSFDEAKSIEISRIVREAREQAEKEIALVEQSVRIDLMKEEDKWQK